MMDYTHEILTAMVDRYERRKGTSAQNGKPQRAVTFDLAKYYPIPGPPERGGAGH